MNKASCFLDGMNNNKRPEYMRNCMVDMDRMVTDATKEKNYAECHQNKNKNS